MAVLIERCRVTSMGILISKIRRSRDRLIFDMRIPIPGKTVLTLPSHHGIHPCMKYKPPEWLWMHVWKVPDISSYNDNDFKVNHKYKFHDGTYMLTSENLTYYFVKLMIRQANIYCTEHDDVIKLKQLLALCAGNWPVIGEFRSQRPVTRSFDGFFDLKMEIIKKQSF